jgi:ferredoxin
MSDDDWEFPAPREDPEIYKVRSAGDDGGAAKLVPDGNFVEGEIGEDARKAPSGCPFSSS